MLLQMASPTRRDGSTVCYLKKRVPADLLAQARGVTLRVPVGDATAAVRVGSNGIVMVSLRTRDPREAKGRQAKALDYLETVWKALREGPRRLTQREVSALAGEAYRDVKAKWEDDPGPGNVWRVLGAAGRWDEATTRREMGPFVTELLERKALTVDPDSQDRLAFALRDVWRDAAELMQRRAANDYGPDRAPERAAWQSNAAPPTNGDSVTALLEGWKAEAKATGLAPKTLQEYGSVISRFVGFLGHDDPARVVPQDVVRWKDDRIAAGLAAKTVKDVYLSALKSVFGWAERNHRIKANPAKGITVKLGKKVQERPKGFTDGEAAALLSAALRYAPAPREGAKTAAAKRWLPWLCAYTGARIGEVAQLRRQDVRKERGHWVIAITPEAGTVKNKRLPPAHRECERRRCKQRLGAQ